VRALGLWARLGFRLPRGSFEFRQQRFEYFRHVYNLTWLNERCVEVPIARSLVQCNQGCRVLEVGNVLSHYFPGMRHDVIDKYERTGDKRVIRADAREYSSPSRFDLIVSVSTIEHIGWDERPIDQGKAVATIRHLGDLLAPDGALVFTVPAGYHPALDRALLEGDAALDGLWALQRMSARNRWEPVAPGALRAARFGAPYPFANGVFVGVLGKVPRFL